MRWGCLPKLFYQSNALGLACTYLYGFLTLPSWNIVTASALCLPHFAQMLFEIDAVKIRDIYSLNLQITVWWCCSSYSNIEHEVMPLELKQDFFFSKGLLKMKFYEIIFFFFNLNLNTHMLMDMSFSGVADFMNAYIFYGQNSSEVIR